MTPDPEANNRSAAEGRPVVHGGNLSAAEWDNVRRAGVLPPAGTVTPSPKPYSPDGDLLNLDPEAQWTPGMQQVAAMLLPSEGNSWVATSMSPSLGADWPYGATYGEGGWCSICRGAVAPFSTTASATR